ncbi:MAG: AraC family transcriptional regulator, partial [Pseudomonadales bacterium]|nr:AraC family transcriptional regulator [Pseudomonadales bacterium]
MKTSSVSVHYVKTTLARAEKAGVDIQPYLDRLDVSEELLQDPTARVPSEQYVAMAMRLVKATNDEFIRVGGIRRTKPGTFALMCHAVINCSNLQRAILRSFQFYNLFLEDIHFRLHKKGEEAIISVQLD